MRSKHIILAAAGILAIAAAVLMRPRDIARITCADGSSLRIQEVTFGTNHTRLAKRWHPSMRGRPPLQKAWEICRDPLRPAAERMRREVPLEWKPRSPGVALWGTWNGQGHNHLFRFVLLEESGKELSEVPTRVKFPSPETKGLILMIPNPPKASRFRMRVLDGSSVVAEFGIRNEN